MDDDEHRRAWRAAVAAIKERCCIETVIGARVALRRSGRTLVGRCPFHDDHTPSLTVYPATRSFYCFGCGTGGDVIDFLRAADRQPWIAVVTALAREVGVALPDAAADEPAAIRRRAIIAAALRHWTAWLHAPTGADARAWLATRRVPMRVAAQFQLGAAGPTPNALSAALCADGWDVASLLDAGLAVRMPNGHLRDRMHRRVMLPLQHGTTHAVVGVTGRTWVSGMTPPYLTLSNTPLRAVLYGAAVAAAALDAAPEPCLVVVEGPFDVLASVSVAPDLPVVGVMTSGLSAMQARQVALLLGGEGTVVLAGDGDAAGAAGMIRSVRALHQVGVTNIRVALLPAGDDPDDVIRRDAAAWRRLLAAAVPPAVVRDALLSRAVPDQTPDAAQRRARLAADLDPAISGGAAVPPVPARPAGAAAAPAWHLPAAGRDRPLPLQDRMLVVLARTAPDVLWTACAAIAMALQGDPAIGIDDLPLPDALAVTPAVARALAAWRQRTPRWDADLPPIDPVTAALPPRPDAVVDVALTRLEAWLPAMPPPTADGRQTLVAAAQRMQRQRLARAALTAARQALVREYQERDERSNP